uniref:8.9 kDa family member n=1 Tax=Rhipicephalus zambeziensis TaxID=60191 RepID=A0A224Y9A9_9ACAR
MKVLALVFVMAVQLLFAESQTVFRGNRGSCTIFGQTKWPHQSYVDTERCFLIRCSSPWSGEGAIVGCPGSGSPVRDLEECCKRERK